MIFATVDELEQAALLDRLARAPGFGRQGFLFGFDIDETRAFDAARHTPETQVADLFGETDGFEQLSATVRGDGGDAHLRQDLQQALGNALAVVLEHLIEVAQHFTGADQVTQHFVRKERVHRRGAKTDQHRKVMRVAGSGGFDEDVGVAAQAFFGQAVVHSTRGQRSVDRQFAWRDVAVGQHDLGTTGAHSFFGLIGDVTHSGFKAEALVVVQVDDLAVEAWALQGHQRAPFGRRNHRRTENDAGSVLRRFLEDVALGTEAHFQRHHDGFAQRVDRRVGHLGELLAEIVVRRAHALGQHGHWRVIAHGADGLVALLAERTQHLVALFERDLVHLHVLLELVDVIESRTVVVVFHGRLDAQGVLAQPLLVRVTRLQAVVDRIGVEDLPGFGVHRQNLARADTAFGDDIFRLVVPYADFRREGDETVGRGDPTRRAQTVTVEQAHRVAAVGHDHTGRAVPRLHVHRVVLVERTQIRVHGFDVLPRWRNDHAHATEQVDAAGDHQLEHVVHAGGVGAHAVDQRAELFEVHQVVGELGATGHGPVAVTRDGVDLAVMGEEAEWLSQRPFRQGVGGEALVEHADCGLQALVAQVWIEGGQIRRHHQAFINDGLVRKAADVVVSIGGVGHRRATTRGEQLDRHVLIAQAIAGDEHLFDLWQALQGQTAEHAGVDRHFAPAHQLQAGSHDLAVHVLASGFGFDRVLVEEHHAHGVLLGQVDSKLFFCDSTQELVGLLNQQAATVTGFAVGVDPTAVGHAGQGLDGRLQKGMTGLALHMGYQAKTAVILEFIGLVQTCFHRHFLTRLPLLPRQISFQFSPLPSTPNVRQLCGGKREVIVHTDTNAHKFSDEMSQIYVAFMKGLKRYAVLVKTFLILTATTQKLL